MEKIKQFIGSDKGKDILIVIIVILVGLGSFELGRLSKNSPNQGLKIQYTDKPGTLTGNVIQATDLVQNTASASENANNSGKAFFASNRGSKYYSLGCSAGKSIKQENKIYFATAEAAERAGYTASASCN